MAEVGAVDIALTLDGSGWATNLTQAGVRLDSFGASTARTLGNVEGSFASLGRAANANGKSLSLNSMQMLELGHSARSTFDILASGQSPLRALQLEGARLIQVLASGEGGVGGAIEGIGSAVVGLATPMNLAIAAVAALGVGAILWLSHEQSATVDATAALEAHKAWLDKILTGYSDTKKAADAYLAAADQLPEAAVSSDLNAKTAPAMANLETALGQLSRYRDELSTDLTQGVEQFGSQGAADSVSHLVDVVKAAGLSATSTKGQFDALVTSLTEISNGADRFGPLEAFLATKMLDLVQNAEKARVAVDSIGVALNNLPTSISVQITAQMKGFTDARTKLLSLVPDQRNEYDRARDDAKVAYGQEVGSAPDAIMRTAAGTDYSKVLAGIDAAQKAATDKKTDSAGESAAKKQQKSIDSVTTSLKNQIAALTSTGRETAIATALTQAHVTATSKDGQAIAALAGQLYDQKAAIEKVNAEWAQAETLTKSFADTFASDLEDGKSVVESLGDAVSNLGKQLIELALNNAITNLFAGLKGVGAAGATAGAASGGSGILSTLIGGAAKLLGFEDGGAAGPASFTHTPGVLA